MKKNIVIAFAIIAAIVSIAIILYFGLNSGRKDRVSEVDGMVMVYIAAGGFPMGYEENVFTDDKYANQFPKHIVYLDGYWIDKTEITNGMFSKFVNATQYTTEVEKIGNGYVASDVTVYWAKVEGASWKTPRGPDSSISGMENHPVVQVTWNDANAYCEWAGRRLPTDAEWEKAARGNDMRMYPWGNNDPTGELANLPDISLYKVLKFEWLNNGIDDGFAFTAPVGSYPKGASPYGILDMAGNVWEWVSDWAGKYVAEDSPSRNPTGPSSGEYHVIRGESWDVNYGNAAVDRQADSPDGRSASLGFRCAYSGE